jgi:SAM-dependent methyltransferase
LTWPATFGKILLVRTDSYYDEDYWNDGKHSGPEWPEPFFQRIMAPVLSGGAVLDYGCGLGYCYQRQLVRSMKRYVGADASGMAVENARKKGLEAVQVETSTGGVPLPGGSFDAAVCIEVFEHLFDPLGAAREINRVLKPGGVLVATVPNFGYHAWRMLAFLRAQVPLEPDGDRFKGVHIRFFSKRMFQRLLREAGFTDVKVGSYGKSSIWDVFQATGPGAWITTVARRHFPEPLHFRFLERVWPNVFAERLRAVARKP